MEGQIRNILLSLIICLWSSLSWSKSGTAALWVMTIEAQIAETLEVLSGLMVSKFGILSQSVISLVYSPTSGNAEDLSQYDRDCWTRCKTPTWLYLWVDFSVLNCFHWILPFKITLLQVEWIKNHQFGGVMVWALDLDDFTGEMCGKGQYPLLTTINTVLGDGYHKQVQAASINAALRPPKGIVPYKPSVQATSSNTALVKPPVLWVINNFVLYFTEILWGHSGIVVTYSPPTCKIRVWIPARPQVGKLVVVCRWLVVYSTKPWPTVCTGFLCP